MGNIEQFSDMTGTMSDAEINAENISNIIDELNRTSDQLDSLNSVLAVIAYGSLDYEWDGTGSPGSPNGAQLVVPVTSAANFIGFCYMQRSSDPTKYYSMPYTEYVENANNDTVTAKFFIAFAENELGQFVIQLDFFNSGSAEAFTFYYTIIQQPANVSS